MRNKHDAITLKTAIDAYYLSKLERVVIFFSHFSSIKMRLERVSSMRRHARILRWVCARPKKWRTNRSGVYARVRFDLVRAHMAGCARFDWSYQRVRSRARALLTLSGVPVLTLFWTVRYISRSNGREITAR